MIDRKKLAKVKSQLSAADIDVLSNAVAFCSGRTGRQFKGGLIGALLRGYDHDRMRKIESVARQLNEEEILHLVENPTPERDERKQRRSRGKFAD